jgi:hypothetical protein
MRYQIIHKSELSTFHPCKTSPEVRRLAELAMEIIIVQPIGHGRIVRRLRRAIAEEMFAEDGLKAREKFLDL